MIRSIIAALILVALNVIPASAQTTKIVKFYMYLDGNGNGVIDYLGSDYCLGGDTLTVYKIGTGLQPWFYMYATHGDNVITTYAQYIDCKNNSSTTYNLIPGDWKVVGGTPSHTTYFNVWSYGGPNGPLVGHRLTSWSGE